MSTKKTWLLDADLIAKAKKIYGARTETETVTRALREIVIRHEIDRAFAKHGPVLADLEQVFSDHAALAHRK